MNSSPILQDVLNRFRPVSPLERLMPLGGGGGLSGAQLWQIHGEHGVDCLRRWPAEHPTAEQLTWIHQLMTQAVDGGCAFVPRLRRTRSGQSMVVAGGHLWELATWMPGEANYHAAPSSEKLRSALRGLASVHQAWQTVAAPSAAAPLALRTACPAPGIAVRWQLASEWNDSALRTLAARIPPQGDSVETTRIAQLCREIAALLPRVMPACHLLLLEARQWTVDSQPCLRDIWHDHVLFQGQQLSGLIDFGAVRYDSPAADLARLLGSLVHDDVECWQIGLNAYAEIRPLTEVERILIPAYDLGNLVFSGIHWIQWLYVEQRTFPLDRVFERLTEIASRLRNQAKAVPRVG